MSWLLLLMLRAVPAFAEEPTGDVERGAYLARAAGCAACHTVPGGEELAGGPPLESRFGVFFGPNITPDPEHGIGRWTLDDFVAAMRRGRSPDGSPYYPAFPYASYTRMTDGDLADLFAWLMSRRPVASASAEQQLRAPYRGRWKLRAWKLIGLSAGPFEPDPAASDLVNRGAYLVTGPGHCGECHTDRGPLGNARRRRALAGSDEPPEPGPNLTPHPDGLGGWTEADLLTFLEEGMTPDGDFAGAGMREVIAAGTALLTAEDRRAIAAYLLSVPARPSKGLPPRPAPEAGEEWF